MAAQTPAELAKEFAALWQNGDSPPNVFGFLQQHREASPQEQFKVLLIDISMRRKFTVTMPSADDYLEPCPKVAGDEALRRQVEEAIRSAKQPILASPASHSDLSPGQSNEILWQPDPAPNNAAVSTKEHIQDTGNPPPASPAADPTEEPALPKTIGGYRIEKELGKGGFGQVFLAFDEKVHRRVAIKAPLAGRLSKDSAESYLEEARAAGRRDHPAIVPVYHVGHSEEFPVYIVSKFIEGTNLRQLLRENRPSFEQSAEIVRCVAGALHYAHKQGLVHRDIKPENILLDRDGRPHVADFGLALKEQHFGNPADQGGTPAYMSPEQARGEGHLVDGRSDIFSLGVVLYELLTGKRPFRGDVGKILEHIKKVDVRPPRQTDESIPKELERICLKALSKRAADRYAAAVDMADDLEHWQTALQHDSRLPTPDSPLPSPAKIIPKGLRSFDENDADFFLELLPGPRDRDGLPESLRFWKTRIEETDSDKTFRVGLLYGPSGCGKSSLIKAGLLPRLANHVLPIYIEATPADTETRIIKSLRKQFPQFTPESAGLTTLSALRRGDLAGSGRKVLLVLDQFEQWLHAHREVENPQLVEALRQCDGAHLQCLVMVRDDFWLAVSRFMSHLEVDLLQGHNMALADLFDLLHARKVLMEFGRAYGRLPDDSEGLSTAQQAFLDSAVDGLSQQGRVVCVRLALFAEMMKGRTWTPETLQQVGGAEGVGVTFLEETFSAATASPRHRLHQRAARAVLKALLPQSGTDIKGNLRSQEELLEASGYARREKDFDELIRILDSEIRLITPTDPEGAAEEPEEAPAAALAVGRFYQLTHDYLVPSLREWLTRKQKETRRGRAELRLAERSSQWTTKPENRNLPAWWEYLNIRALTRKKDWTAPHQKMMQRAGRFHGLRAAALLFILAVLGWGAYEVNGYVRAMALVDKLASAKEDAVLDTAAQLQSYQRWARPRLKTMANTIPKSPEEERGQLHARLALVAGDESLVLPLRDALLQAPPAYIAVIRQALRPFQSQIVDQLWETLHNTAESPQRRFNAGLALADYARGSKKGTPDDVQFLVQQLLAANPEHQPRLRELLRPIASDLLPEIEKSFHNRTLSDSEQRAAANGVADYAGQDGPRLARLLTTATPAQYGILYPLVAGSSDSGVKKTLGDIASQKPAENLKQAQRLKLGKQRAGAAITLLRQGEREEIFSALRVDDDPESLTQFIHRCRDRDVQPEELLDCLQIADALRQKKTGEARKREDRVFFGLLLALGEFPLSDLPVAKREPLVKQVADWYARDPSSAVHGACGWLLRHWGRTKEAEKVDRTALPYDPQREWFTVVIQARGKGVLGTRMFGRGQLFSFTFIVFSAGEYEIGSPKDEPESDTDETRHKVQISRSFAVLDREITRAEFEAFGVLRFRGYERISPSPAHAMNGPSWYDAVRFCRGLTQQAGLEEEQQAYPDPTSLDEQQYPPDPIDRDKAPKDWPVRLERSGFRLPSEAEWEIACRGGMGSTYGYGYDVSLLERYGWFVDNSQKQAHVPRSLRPNHRGLFDMHGNIWEWCHDWYASDPPKALPDPIGATEGADRVYRGGGWLIPAAYCRSANRLRYRPTGHNSGLGFRVARGLSGKASPAKEAERRAEADRSVGR